MNRILVWPAQVPQDTDILNASRFSMIGLGAALLSILGSGTYTDGLACTPGTGLAVNIGPGAIYALTSVDATSYGSLAANTTDQTIKQGLAWGQTAVAGLAAPGTAGQSIVWLIEAQFQEVDALPVQLPYYNPANPVTPLFASNNTVRQGVCALQAKQGVAAATGSQVAPSPDAGWTPLYTVTVANGQVSITTANISLASNAPFIATKLGQMENVKTISAGQAINATHGGLSFTATAPLTLTLGDPLTLPNGFNFTALAQGGIVTVTPPAGRTIANGVAGASYSLPVGASAMFVRDDTGTNFSVFYFSNPLSNSLLKYVRSSQTIQPGYYLVDSTDGSFTLTLESNPTRGDMYKFEDAAATWGTNPVTLARNGQTIMGLTQDLVLNIADQQFSLWFNKLNDWRLL